MSVPRALISYRNAGKLGPYLEALRAAGIEPVPVTPGQIVSDAQGLVLTGGSDVDPKYFGQSADPELGEVDAERDAFELDLLSKAEAADLPILAICRGMQLLNVHRGGTLIQHLAETERHRRSGTPASQAVHSVEIVEGSRLVRIFGTTEARVNSRHHQAVGRLGAGLVVSARDAEDGVVEGIEDPSRIFAVGVQWHPEDQAASDAVQARLFAAFGNAMAGLDVR